LKVEPGSAPSVALPDFPAMPAVPVPLPREIFQLPQGMPLMGAPDTPSVKSEIKPNPSVLSALVPAPEGSYQVIEVSSSRRSHFSHPSPNSHEPAAIPPSQQLHDPSELAVATIDEPGVENPSTGLATSTEPEDEPEEAEDNRPAHERYSVI